MICNIFWTLFQVVLQAIMKILRIYVPVIQIQGISKLLDRFQSAITVLETHAEVSFPHETKQQAFQGL
jgi:hypothetical protein